VAADSHRLIIPVELTLPIKLVRNRTAELGGVGAQRVAPACRPTSIAIAATNTIAATSTLSVIG
jgi:hypothetical protein